MTETTNKTLDNFFDSPTVYLPEEITDLPVTIDHDVDEAIRLGDNVELEYIRNNVKDIIANGMLAAKEVFDFAKAGQSARGFEVYATMMERLINANEKLLDIQLKQQKILQQNRDLPTGDGPAVQNVTNNILVGTTSDILKMLANARKNEIDGTVVTGREPEAT